MRERSRSSFRRGFKTEAATIARQIRAEMQLSSFAPLDPWALADHLGIPIHALSAMRADAPSAFLAFSGPLRAEFSAVTVFRGSYREIVHNDHHAVVRQRSNLAHELAHALLLHPPTPALNDCGGREWDPVLEAEAGWLGPALLVPEDAALVIVRRRKPVDEAAQEYGVSETMMNFRIAVCGARQRVQRFDAARS